MNSIQQVMHEYDGKVQEATKIFEQAIAQADEELRVKLSEIFETSKGVPSEQKSRVKLGDNSDQILVDRDRMEFIMNQLDKMNTFMRAHPHIQL